MSHKRKNQEDHLRVVQVESRDLAESDKLSHEYISNIHRQLNHYRKDTNYKDILSKLKKNKDLHKGTKSEIVILDMIWCLQDEYESYGLEQPSKEEMLYAFTGLKFAAEQNKSDLRYNYLEVFYNLGNAYAYGNEIAEIKPNIEEAKYQYFKAKSKGEYGLGLLYYNIYYDEQYVQKRKYTTLELAVQHLEKAKEQGIARAGTVLGNIYLNGAQNDKGFQAIKPDSVKALELYKLDADSKFPSLQGLYNCAEILFKRQNFTESVKYCLKAKIIFEKRFLDAIDQNDFADTLGLLAKSLYYHGDRISKEVKAVIDADRNKFILDLCTQADGKGNHETKKLFEIIKKEME